MGNGDWYENEKPKFGDFIEVGPSGKRGIFLGDAGDGMWAVAFGELAEQCHPLYFQTEFRENDWLLTSSEGGTVFRNKARFRDGEGALITEEGRQEFTTQWELERAMVAIEPLWMWETRYG